MELTNYESVGNFGMPANSFNTHDPIYQENVTSITNTTPREGTSDHAYQNGFHDVVPSLLQPASIVIHNANNGSSGEAALLPSAPLLIPSLRGTLVNAGAASVCRGMWAMSDAAHDIPGQSSEFEIRLVKAAENSTEFPFSGQYQGWFNLKQPLPLKGSIKIDDKEINLTFTKNDHGNFDIVGNGSNKFGNFTLNGSLNIDSGNVQMYRQYLPKVVGPPFKAKKALAASLASTKPKTPIADDGSPREGASRVRKVSSILKGYDDPTQKSATPKASSTPKSIPTQKAVKATAYSSSTVPSIPFIKQESASGRAQRLSQESVKCQTILTELSKHPNGVFFNEPVDHVKLGIPDYPKIIHRPMDFSTIRDNLVNSSYQNVESFANDMRLVFDNAMTYNQDPVHLVHKAAKDLKAKFEQRYHILKNQLAYNQPVAEPLIKAGAPKKKLGRTSLGGNATKGFGSAPLKRKADMYAPVPVVDVGVAHLVDMQRKMEELANEVIQLRTQIRKNDVSLELQQKKEASQNPLTYEEKKMLMSKISRLPPSERTMEEVIQIIKEAHPVNSNGDDDEIEISLDDLDTLTLRKLQKLIEGQQRKNPVPAAKPARKPGPPPAKKVKREAVSSYAVPAPNIMRPLPESVPASSGAMFSKNFDELRDAQFGGGSDDENDKVGGGSLMDFEDMIKTDDLVNDSVISNVANASAWTSGIAKVPAPIANNVNLTNTSNNWSSVKSEIDFKNQCEQDRKLEEEKLNETRSKNDTERHAALQARAQQQAIDKLRLEQEGQRREEETERQRSEQVRQLQRRREEERLQRENLERSITLGDQTLEMDTMV